jgi:hypothetical protein
MRVGMKREKRNKAKVKSVFVMLGWEVEKMGERVQRKDYKERGEE